MKEGIGENLIADSQHEVVERVKARLQEEGREARNLVAYSLPLQDPPPSENVIRHREVKRVVDMAPRRGTKSEKRPRSASAGRDPKLCLRARHWGFLFRNLQQAVDEIYQTCEDDESVVECKEAILILERYTSDFKKLIEWLKVKWEYEHTPPPQRPNSVSWEIRTSSSPGKAINQDKKMATLSEVRRALTYEMKPDKIGNTNNSANVEKKVTEKLPIVTPGNDGPSDVKVVTPSKPIIVVHQASIEEQQEENLSKSDTESKPDVTKEEVHEVKSTDVVAPTNVCENNCQVVEVVPVQELSHEPLESIQEKEGEKEANIIEEEDEVSVVKSECSENAAATSSDFGVKTGTPEVKGDLPFHENKDISVLSSDDSKTSDEDKKDEIASEKEKEVSMKTLDSPKSKESKPRTNAQAVSSKPKDCTSTCKVQEASQKGQEIKNTEAKAENTDAKRSCAEVVLGRSSSSKPVPTVNMNKASQVRQAYNQNRTPQKHPRPVNPNNRQPSPRVAESKGNVTKQQGSGGRLTLRRVGDNKSTSSPPSVRKTVDGRSNSGASRQIFTRSYTTLASPGKGLMRANTTVTDSRMAKHPGINSYSNNALNSQERATSSSSLSSSTSSSGLSWADKVRGVPVSLQSSQLSLQDDGEGWEVVRRGRRSHGGSTASLNNSSQYQQHSYSNRDSRSGSLKDDGHKGRGMKNRFHMPSAAMSVPSLAVSNSSTKEEVDNQSVSSTNGNTQRSALNSGGYSGKKSKSQGCVMSAKDDNVTNERKKTSSNSTRSAAARRIENRRNRAASKSAEELRKNHATKGENKGKDNIAWSNKENKSPTCDIVGHICDDIANVGIKEVASQKASESLPLSENLHGKYSNNINYLCDPSIPETSETSDIEDSDKGKVSDSRKLSSYESEDKDVDIQERFLFPAERDNRSYDSDSIMDEEEMFNIVALESAIQEEQRLKKQIEETEKEEIKVEDVDCEEDGSDVSEAVGRATSPLTPPYDSLLASLSWADQVDMMESLEELRHPGRLLHIHEKLSSPSRKRSLSEKMKRYEEKLAKAQELREKLMQAKTDKLKDLFKKIEEVRLDKEMLLDEKRQLFQRKMKKAEEKRRQYLQEIVNKAHDEENKAKEIAFINGLEAQNKLHDIMQQHQSLESRLADMAEERTRRQEEKAAKEVAAQERRRALEAERQARMAELCEKRRRKCERIDRKQAERREELLEQAREKARDREERLSALQQAQQAKESELVKKIQQKQEESARRHEENIKQIRQRALESSIMKYSRGCDDAPKLVRYETKKLCTLCNSLITSEVYLLSHLRGPRHQEALRALHQAEHLSVEDSETYNLKHIIDAPANIDDPQVTRDKERQKALKRRCKKIRTRMTTRGKEYNSTFKPTPVKESPNKSRINKALQQITKLVANQGSGPWPVPDIAALDKPLLELLRILEKKERLDQLMFSALDGFGKIDSVLKVILDSTEQRSCVLPAKSLGYCGRVILGACLNNLENCEQILYSNLAGTLIDYLMHRLNELVIETTRLGSDSSINTIVSLPSDAASGAIFKVLAEIMEVLHEGHIKPGVSSPDQAVKDKADATWIRLQDLVSYCVSVGLADKITWYFSYIQGPLDNDPGVVEITLSAMNMVAALAKALTLRNLPDDPTQLIGTLHVTDACGVVSLLYGILLHQGGRSALPQAPPKLSQTTQALTIAATTLLHNLASLNLIMFQGVLGSEGISLELRHIASYLLWYCSYWPCEEILHNVIALVGYYAVNNKENQMVIQSGEVPSVLQQLCNLPWQYFSDPHLTAVLFPTLLACCLDNPDNMVILQQEMSFQVLEDFLHNGQASDKPLVSILQRTHVQG
ncbi:calponin homology domain-containing protein DDB_G0272472 isoform X1 [Macrobrachium rosenbergii]|uniref:calponin homology domain-containing protein DDB_G0272472 isoform X1 n=2 Tax=Macrobrachium rosenbergii TaxID=79674 RepID=UPI0034D66390